MIPRVTSGEIWVHHLWIFNLYVAEIETFVEEHLTSVNAEVDKYNSEIELESYPDLFDW